MITQKAMNPAFAPNMVVAINSPEPTIEADKIKPGPRNFNLLLKEVGGHGKQNEFIGFAKGEDKRIN
jgi:hypothetical protein